MNYTEIIAQCFGIVGLILSTLSYQEKNNKYLFIKQGLGGLMFSLNYFMIGALPAALFNLVNLVRGMLFLKNKRELWRLFVIVGLYIACFVLSLISIIDIPLQVILSSSTFLSLILMTVLMWLGNGKHIRYGQFFFASPVWLIHNIFNFSLGGILCEIFAMTSVVVSFIRYGKDGFEQ